MLKEKLKQHSVLLAALFVMLLWGSLFPMVKLGYRAFSVDTAFVPNILLFAGLRFLICGILISLFAAGRKLPMRLEGRDVLPVLAVGLVAVTLHYAFTYLGLANTASSETALLKQLGVFIFIPLSFLFFKDDAFSLRKVAGAVLGLLGVVVLSFKGGGLSFGLGELMVVEASFCTVIANVLGKRTMQRVHPLTMTGYSQLFGGALLTVIGLFGGGGFGELSWTAIPVGLYIIAASVVSYSLWYTIVKSGDLSRLFIIKFTEPIFASLLGALLLSEDIFNIRFLLALVITAAAVLLSGEKKKEK